MGSTEKVIRPTPNKQLHSLHGSQRHRQFERRLAG